MQSQLLKNLYHFTVYAVGVLVLLTAVIVTTVRILFPDIGIYRSEIEAWVSKYMGYPVVIHNMDAKWQGWIPELYLSDIDLLNKAGTQPITHFDHARVLISPIATLIERQIIPRSLSISGFNLSIAHLSNGAIYIEGVKLEGMDKTRTDKNELAEWLFKQDNIRIQNANITWIDIKNQQAPISLSNVSVQLRNDVGRFQVEGSATLPAEYGKNLDFAFDSFGNLLSSNWSGELYLAGTDINPDKWYTNFRPGEFDVSGGSADVQVWSSWKTAQLTRLEGELDFSEFDALSGRNKLHIKELSYRFSGERRDVNNWDFQVKINNFVTENGPWPDADISFALESTGPVGKYRYIASFSYLKLRDLATLVSDFSILPENIRRRLGEITFDGELSNGKFIYNPDKPVQEQLSFNVDFNQLSTDISDLPSISGLSGNINGSLAEGIIKLKSRPVEVSMHSMGIEKIAVTELGGEMNWARNDSGWQLKTDLLNILTADLTLNLSGSISRQSEDTSPMLEMVVNMGPADVENIIKYIPVTEKFKLKNWMEMAIAGGTVNSASALLRGHLGDFPFDDNNGRFQLIADISGGSIDYSQYWPPVDQIDTELIFEGRKLTAKIQNGMIFNAEISEAIAVLPDILARNKTLLLDGHVSGLIKDLTIFVDQSPLKNNMALYEVRKSIENGEFELDLDLGIPLRQPGVKPDVNGTIYFSNAELYAPTLRIRVSDVNGPVSFSRESVLSEPITAKYLEKPVTITVAGRMNDPQNPPIFSLKGTGDNAFIVDRLQMYIPATIPLKDYLLDRITGETDWKVNLGIVQNDETKTVTKTLEISSNLQGLAIELPEPLNKTKDKVSLLSITTDLTESNLQGLNINFDSKVSCHLELDRDTEFKLQKADLKLGTDAYEHDNLHKLQVHGTIDKLSVEKWIEIIKLLTKDSEKSHPIFDDTNITVAVNSLDLFHQIYNDVKVSGTKHDRNWLFTLDGTDISGDVSLPARMLRDRIISLQMDKLVISEQSGAEQENKLDPLLMPSIIINIDDFTYRNYHLGEFRMTSSVIDNGLLIDQFEMSKPDLIIHGSGKWLSESDGERSSFNIYLGAENMDVMLKTFAYDVTPVKNGKTTLNINAAWKGAPMNFAFNNLNGNLEMQIEKGQFLDIDPSAGRLFGLLSIQTLPRRLLLDFSDIFGKGLTFDSIDGGFEITDGNAYTNDLFMRGPAAEIMVTGRTGLADKDYDQIVTVTPQIANSLPVASALFGPVGIGVGAVIYLFNSLNDNIDKLLRYQYTITGHWDDPVIKKIKDKEVVANIDNTPP